MDFVTLELKPGFIAPHENNVLVISISVDQQDQTVHSMSPPIEASKLRLRLE